MSGAQFKECRSCDRETNNTSFNCAIKGDYRLFTDWRPRCSTQYLNMLAQKDYTPTSLEHRMFLTHNADELMKINAQNAYMKARCGPCEDSMSWNVGTMLPEYDKQECNTRTCNFSVSDPWGLGRGRMYMEQADDVVRAEFIKEKEKENEYFKQTAECCGTTKDDLYYYPIDGEVSSGYSRYAVPSGGMLMSGGDRLQ
jgi:hypothetical protein